MKSQIIKYHFDENFNQVNEVIGTFDTKKQAKITMKVFEKYTSDNYKIVRIYNQGGNF